MFIFGTDITLHAQWRINQILLKQQNKKRGCRKTILKNRERQPPF
jgi:hypothetical protein